MQNPKLRNTLETLGNAKRGIAVSPEKWCAFLETAVQNYKYSFQDQVMIYAHKPNATALAEYEKWQGLNRQVKRGTKGIPLIETNGRKDLRYVYDYSDTVSKGAQRENLFWEVTEENEKQIADALHQRFRPGADDEMLDEILIHTARQIRLDFVNSGKLRELARERAKQEQPLTPLEDWEILDKYGEPLVKMIDNSVIYCLLTKCGYNPADYFEKDDFRYLRDLTVNDIDVLGNIVNNFSKEILREIEHTAKAERSKQNERGQYSNRRNAGRSDDVGRTDTDVLGGNGEAEDRTLRQGAAKVSDREQTEAVLQDVDGNGQGADRPLGVNRQGSKRTTGYNRGANGENAGREREDESRESDVMGGADEQSDGFGEGDSLKRTDLSSDGGMGSAGRGSAGRGNTVLETPDSDIEANRDNPDMPELKRGDIISFDGSRWQVEGVDGDFSINLNNIDPADIRSGQSFFGDWKEKLVGYEIVGYENIKETSKSRKRSVKSERSKNDNRQMSLFDDVTNDTYDIDEQIIKAELMHGSGVQDGKFRIEEFAKTNPANTDFAEFLKNEYGWGGCSGRVIHDMLNSSDHNGKGIFLTVIDDYSPDNKRVIHLSYNDVARRIAELVQKNEYITPEDVNSRIGHAEFVLKEYIQNPPNPDDSVLFSNTEINVERAKNVLAQYGLLEETEANREKQETLDNYSETEEDTETASRENPETSEIADKKDEYYFKSGDILRIDGQDVEIMKYFKDGGLITFCEPGQDEVLNAFYDRELVEKGFEVIKDTLTAPARQEQSETAILENPEMTEIPQAAELSVFGSDVGPRSLRRKENETLTAKAENFRITDDNLGIGSAKTKFQNNIEAIKLLKEIEHAQFIFERGAVYPDRNPYATQEEQEILSKYVGWGGIPQAFDEGNSSWGEEYKTLKDLLSDYEYEAARESTLNAHYTSPTVIRAIYSGLESMGFTSGNVLEPAMGAGNFFGMLPDSMKESKLFGVELDDISGRISKLLYPKAKIKVQGYEDTHLSDNFFDVAVGNVPFGGYKLPDKRYDKLNLNIHDYFFAKTLDKVRPGGIIAFITSKGTLDKQNSKFREYLAERADLLGAVRLPNNAFEANAGTKVTSDIIFLQKRESVAIDMPEWVHLGKTKEGIPVNRYFEDNPEMLLGTMAREDKMYGNVNETTCNPIDGAVLSEQLKTAIGNIKGVIPDYEHGEDVTVDSIPADDNVRNYSYAVVDDKLYYRENSRMNRVELPVKTEERIKGMIEIRDCARELIDIQLNDSDESNIVKKQFKLNTLFDSFIKKYGLINSSANRSAFREDSGYPLLSSLEILNEQGELERKADMFTKRTIKQHTAVTSVNTASEALAVSIAEKARVDLDFMAQLANMPKERIIEDLNGVIYQEPFSENYVTADEFLSGNIREKLTSALQYQNSLENPADYADNVEALKAAMPKDLEASDIDVRLGSTWIEPETIKEFILETLKSPSHMRYSLNVHYSPLTSEWQIDGKNSDTGNTLANAKYGTTRVNAYALIEDTLNLRSTRVYDRVERDGKVSSVLNDKETMLAQEKQEDIKRVFKDWIFNEPERRAHYVEKYNVIFNSTRPREYDGRHITFSGMNPEIKLRTHQVNAIAHAMYGGNTLLAHVVGAGKTYEMIAIAMESKRLGLCNKSLFVVPKHITEQIGSDFLRLYPSANILVATAKDFERKNRRRLIAKIATGDYDAVIIGHSQLEKIPISQERQERMIRGQIAEITDGIKELAHSEGDRFTVKQMEKTKKSLETRLTRLIESPERDNVVTFEELGVDKMFIDEAHGFKNLYSFTKMRNVAGLQQTEAQKASDLYMKCQYLDEKTHSKGVVFATGTPISNTMVELHTMMKYLQSDTLEKRDLSHFDAWAANFGETISSLEIAPEGNGYRARTRFARFFNLPELMNLFKECADIKTADMLNLPVPEAEYRNIVVKPTEHQKAMISNLSERARMIKNRMIKPEDDNMLCITNDGRKIGLDQRLMNPLLPDENGTKVNVCIDNIHQLWQDTTAEKSTQLVFCDFSTPKADGSFNLYDDIRGKLVVKGVPKAEIAFIHEADSEEKKKELFAKVRKGTVRVLLGSTSKMGSGTNVQDKLIAIHDLDCPCRPSDLEQRHGRGIRQGNENEKIYIFRYVTDSSFDAYLYQMVENKQRHISQIMTSKSPARSCEDLDETTLSYAEVKALCAGNPLIKEKIDLDVSVVKLKVMKAEHTNQQYRIEDSVMKHFPESIRRIENRIKGYKIDIEHLKTLPAPADKKILPMVIMNMEFTDKEAAGNALIEACRKCRARETLDIGSYKGFDMSINYDGFNKEFTLELQNEMSYSVSLGADAHGNITRIENALKNIPSLLENGKAQLETLQSQLENAKGELGKPFPQEAELQEKQKRLTELNYLLSRDTSEQDSKGVPDIGLAADKQPGKIIADGTPPQGIKAYRENHDTPKKPPITIADKIKQKNEKRKETAPKDVSKTKVTVKAEI